jgi:hypothetical protein
MSRMEEAVCLVAYASLAHVQRVRRKLLDGGTFVDMIRTPGPLARKGCGFALRAPRKLLPVILAASLDAKISVSGAFVETADGYGEIP